MVAEHTVIIKPPLGKLAHECPRKRGKGRVVFEVSPAGLGLVSAASSASTSNTIGVTPQHTSPG
jgi:hypothetical protein